MRARSALKGASASETAIAIDAQSRTRRSARSPAIRFGPEIRFSRQPLRFERVCVCVCNKKWHLIAVINHQSKRFRGGPFRVLFQRSHVKFVSIELSARSPLSVPRLLGARFIYFDHPTGKDFVRKYSIHMYICTTSIKYAGFIDTEHVC